MAQTLRKRLKIKVLSKKSVSAIFERPAKARALLVLAHGAGAGMEHAFLRDLAKSLHEEGVATLRFQFPYMEEGSKRPDSPDIAVAAVMAWVSLGAAWKVVRRALGELAEPRGQPIAGAAE